MSRFDTISFVIIGKETKKMDKGIKIKPQPFDSCKQTFKILQVAGYCKLFDPRNRRTLACHKIYRVVVMIIVFIYATQKATYAVIIRNDQFKLLEALALTIPEVSLCYKIVTMFQTKRLDGLEDLMKDPIFGANNKHDEDCIKNNNVHMHKLSKFCVIGLSCVAVFWITAPIFQRLQDETTGIASYIPFETDTWPRFLLAQLMDTCVLLWVGYGNLHIDILIGTYFSQAQLQLSIIKYNFEHMFGDSEPRQDEEKFNNQRFQYIDVLDETLQERFVHYVKRYERVVWFTKEITSIFGRSIAFQFILAAISTCLVVYQMSTTNPASVQFAFLVGFYLVTQFQIFIYCYYGGLIEYESKFVVNSLYLGQWQALSPRFRRQFLIAMARWTIPITPRVSNIVPLSLTTFISLTRTAYTLYTVLKSRNNRGSGERTLAF